MLTAHPTEGDHAFATCSYTAMKAEYGVAVRTSVGRPRWPLKYPLDEYVRELAPFGLISDPRLKDDMVAFEEAYLARLEVSALLIHEKLVNLQAKHGERPLVLLCFENVHEGKVCHRLWLSSWLKDRFDLDVPEISVPTPKRNARPDMPSLF